MFGSELEYEKTCFLNTSRRRGHCSRARAAKSWPKMIFC